MNSLTGINSRRDKNTSLEETLNKAPEKMGNGKNTLNQLASKFLSYKFNQQRNKVQIKDQGVENNTRSLQLFSLSWPKRFEYLATLVTEKFILDSSKGYISLDGLLKGVETLELILLVMLEVDLLF